MKRFRLTVSVFSLLILASGCSWKITSEDNTMVRFEMMRNKQWNATWADPCTQNWKDHWTLEGLKAEVKNDQNGMSFTAGPTFGDDSCHAVLWTKDSFEGDIKIEFDYTRLDNETKCVNIIYIQATGTGDAPYTSDITEWSSMRKIPSMKTYFHNMNTYQISFAAFQNDDGENKKDYIRARRYLPEAKQGLRETQIDEAYFDTGFFKQGVPHKITVMKRGDELFMHVQTEEKEMLYDWDGASHPPITEGRIGLRHMYTRSATYSNFKISTLNETDTLPHLETFE